MATFLFQKELNPLHHTVPKIIYFHITLVYALRATRNGITANASTKFG